ncbi:MAG: helix-turn-helix transcriptional regulator [Phycisphaeraceae bacterium]|nr:helix-turn-helix transcriptional regulator [Phycisphaeraceae bacterium]
MNLPDMPWLRTLEDPLWQGPDVARRSEELTPLYVQRYAGPRDVEELSAHPFWELIYVFGGRGRFICPAACRLAAGHAVLIPPTCPHREQVVTRLDTLWIGLKGTRLDELPTDRVLHAVDAGLTPWATALWLCAGDIHAPVGPELDGLVGAMLGRVLRRWHEQQHLPAADLVQHAIRIMREKPSQPLRMDELAAKLGYSTGYFQRAFHRQTGKTPARFLLEQRIAMAQKMLAQSNLPVARIAAMVGFKDPLHFSRAFSRIVGRSPTQSRRQHRPSRHEPRP